jgi:putative SOS response-associated peptidase YedK
MWDVGQPWCIRMRDGRPFAFAGLWGPWTDPEGWIVESCTIVTTTPNEIIGRFHHRMPVVISPGAYESWLDPQLHEVERLLPLLVPYPATEMIAYPVSSYVNSPANDSPACLTPARR